MTSETTQKSGLLYGVAAIGSYLGLNERQTRHKIDCGLLPTFKMGNIVCSSRATLDQWLADREAEARASVARD